MVSLGWRAYNVTPDDPPKGPRHLWPHPWHEATCDHRLHRAPNHSCRCGVHGSYATEDALLSNTRCAILALARPSGRVIRYPGGWRAERADVVCAWADKGTIRYVTRHWPSWQNIEWRDIEELLLPGVCLALLDLKAKELSYVNLEGADLYLTDLSGANLRGANLKEAELHMANLTAADLTDANIEGGDLSNADLTDANLYRAKLARCDLESADLARADLQMADLTDATALGANFEEADLKGACLRGVRFDGVTLKGADLRGADLKGARLEDANLDGCDLSEWNLSGAVL